MKRGIVVGAVALIGIWTPVAPAQAGASTRSYVVMVKDGRDPADAATAAGVAPTEVWDAVGGFAADLTNQQVNRLRADPAVGSVELDADRPAGTVGQGSYTPSRRTGEPDRKD